MSGPFVIINPGTGQVPNAKLRHAWKSARALLREANIPRTTLKRRPDYDEEGRYGFTFTVVKNVRPRVGLLQVPGLKPEEWRGSLLRCYVDGNSWQWRFAVNTLRDDYGPRATRPHRAVVGHTAE